MLKRFIIVFIALISLSVPLQCNVLNSVGQVFSMKKYTKDTTIKVLVEKELPGVTIDVKGTYNVYDPYNGRRLATRFAGKANYMEPLPSGLRWGEMFPSIYQVVIVPDNETVTTIVNGTQYRGMVYVYQVNGKVSVINEVSIEDYIVSILSSQIPADLSMEALSAITIAARTDALYQVKKTKGKFWDIKAEDVNYEGYAVTQQKNGVEEMVAQTRNLVLHSSVYPFNPVATNWINNTNSDAIPLSITEVNKMASVGKNADAILAHFYPNSLIDLVDRGRSHHNEVAER